jgi:hypothetical protein
MIAINRPWTCQNRRADEPITVDIPRPLPDNSFEMTACLRGPGLVTNEASVARMLESVQVTE